MKRKQIITELKKYFGIQELVCSHTFKKWGEKSWNFLDTNYLHCLLIIRRDIIKEKMTCNTATQNQRGLRCNLCTLVREKTLKGDNYLTQHGFGKGGDFNTVGNVITAENMRQKIKENKNLLPCPIRIEKAVNWLHFDVMDICTDDKITEFNG